MAAPVSRPAARSGTLGSLWWLPPGGFGNGLDDDAWAPVLTISERVVPRALSLLQQVGVPAYAAPAQPLSARLRRRAGQPPGWQLWVGSSAYGEAEAALLAMMPLLAREAARSADTAWR